jgi:hypothetical protein
MPTYRLLTPLKTPDCTLPAGATLDLPAQEGRDLLACGAAEGPLPKAKATNPQGPGTPGTPGGGNTQGAADGQATGGQEPA